MSKAEPVTVDTPHSFTGRIGVARRDITPPVGIYARQWGAALHDVAQGVHRPLCLTAMAISPLDEASTPKGEHAGPLVLVAADVGWWQNPDEIWGVLDPICHHFGLERRQIMFACSHTHAACSVTLAHTEKAGGEFIPPYVETIRTRLKEAIGEALQTAQPSTLTWATGRCSAATNRDILDPTPGKDRWLCGYNPENDADDTLVVGRVTRDSDSVVTATIVNYACHPTTLAWENDQISPDFIGGLREVVEGETAAAPCLFLQGASGELGPKLQYTGDTRIADQVGRQIGFAAMSAIMSMNPPREEAAFAEVRESGAPLGVWRTRPFTPSSAFAGVQVDVDMPLRDLPSEEEVMQLHDAETDRTMKERLFRKLLIIRRIAGRPTMPVPVWIWRVGDGVFIGHAQEAYSKFQIDLRAAFPEKSLAVMGVVNGAVGYLPPPEYYSRDIYQVWQTPFAPEALETLTSACAKTVSTI